MMDLQKLAQFIDTADALKNALKNQNLKYNEQTHQIEKINSSEFEVGDWIYCKDKFSNGKHYAQIVDIEKSSIDPNNKRCWFDHGTWLSMNDIINTCKPWTIKYAKDGDIIATDFFVFIFKEIVIENDEPMISYYCAYEIEPTENISQEFHKAANFSRMGSANTTYYTPATKKQCQTLHDKMTKYGYKWDSKHKQLIKTINHPDNTYTSIKNYEKVMSTSKVYKSLPIIYPTIGLNGEAGEVAEKVKKCIRDNNGKFDEETKQNILKELADVLWYTWAIANDMGYGLKDIMKTGMKKVIDRQNTNTIHGNGDNRENS